MNEQQYLRENEIDLPKLWKIFIKYKLTVIVITLVTTISSATYVIISTPIYSGHVLIEVGEVVNSNQIIDETKPTTIFHLDDLHNLKEITSSTTGISAEIPKEATTILRLSVESPNQSEIKPKLENAVKSIISRHQEKAKLYQNNGAKIRMTQMIGNITVTDQPIKPKKGLIIGVALLSGLMLGILGAFFREFIASSRNDK